MPPPHPHFGSMKKIEVKGGKLTVKFMLYKAIGTLCYKPPPPFHRSFIVLRSCLFWISLPPPLKNVVMCL